MYFLDTNTCIYFLNGKHENVKARILGTSPGEIKIPSVVKAELLLGALKSQHKKSNAAKIERFLEPFEIVPFDDAMTHTYADIRYKTEEKGDVVGPNDLFIATIAKFHQGVLVTHNSKEFGRIEGLKLDDWAR